jgi:predicted phosphoadenosine phosphosulfate sulfurtransferase
MKTLIATAILAMAIASPALAQRAQAAPQRGYQSQQNGYYNGYPVQDWYHEDVWLARAQI